MTFAETNTPAARAARNVPNNPNPLCRDFAPKPAPSEFWCANCGWNEPMHADESARAAIAAELARRAAADVATVDCFDVEIYNGENLKALGVGNYLELAKSAAGMQPGTWQLVEYHGEFQDRATLRPVPSEELAVLRQAESEKLAAIFGGNR